MNRRGFLGSLVGAVVAPKAVLDVLDPPVIEAASTVAPPPVRIPIYTAMMSIPVTDEMVEDMGGLQNRVNARLVKLAQRSRQERLGL